MENKFAQSYRSVQNAISSESDSSDSDSGDDAWKRKSSRKRVISRPTVKDMDTKPTLPTDDNTTDGNTSCAFKKRKLNTVWCNVLQEQTVADDLIQFGLKTKPVSYQDRSCESYDFRLGALDKRGSETSAMEGDFKDTCDEIKSDDDSNENSDKNGSRCQWPKSKRENKDVVVKVAKKIIRVLNEPKHYIIYKAVEVLGSKRALELLQETEKIEDDGGMFVMDNSRRRTPGGIFLQLLKKDTTVSNKKKSLIFAEDRRITGRILKRQLKHPKKKKKKNSLEPMEIVFEPTDDKVKKEPDDEDEKEPDDEDEKEPDNEDEKEPDDEDEKGPDDEDGKEPDDDKDKETVEQNGSFNGTNGTDVHDVENNMCVKQDSELEEGEITD